LGENEGVLLAHEVHGICSLLKHGPLAAHGGASMLESFWCLFLQLGATFLSPSLPAMVSHLHQDHL